MKVDDANTVRNELILPMPVNFFVINITLVKEDKKHKVKFAHQC